MASTDLSELLFVIRVGCLFGGVRFFSRAGGGIKHKKNNLGQINFCKL